MKQGLNSVVVVLSMLAVAVPVVAASDPYEEGTHYVELRTPIRTRDPSKIEVTEYFSYGCQHCYRFDPLIESWHENTPDDVVFNRTPAIWDRTLQVYAQTYYTAEALGVLEKAHPAIFNAIHLERKPLNNPAAMADLFAQFGVTPEDFAKVYGSFGVRANLQQAEARGRAYRATGVPTIIVNGKYRVQGDKLASNAEMLKVAEFLVAKERAAKTKNP